jgi:hypothetical protein
MTRINMDALASYAPRLHRVVIKHTGVPATGEQEVDLMTLPQFTRGELLGWLTESDFAKRKYKPATDIAAAAVNPPEPPIDFEQTLREDAADIQRRVDEAAGRNRLEQYAREQGLENTQQNATAIRQWLDENVKGYLSEKGVDLAIQWLGPRAKNVLTWRKPEAPPSAPAPEPATEVLEPLPSGERRLALDETPTKKHSTAQLKDWLARTNANRIIRPSGSFRVSIF